MDIELFLFTLPIMAKGMLFIFIVIALIMFFIILLNRLTEKKQ